MKFLYTTKYPLVENATPKSPVQPLDEIEELENSLETNLNQEVQIPKDVLDSFKIKDSLNPQIWPDGQLDPQVQKKLLRIANGFIKDIKIPKGSKIKDIIFTGSLANFNWSKFSDIDLHVILDYNQFDGDPKMIEGFFKAQKDLWELEHDIKIFDFPVQAYAQDSNQELVATAVYSILKDKWVKKPKREAFNIDKKSIKKKAEAFISKLKDIRDDYKNHDYQSVVDKVTKVKDKIKQMRKAGLESGGEFSLENIVFKTLRRTPFMDILDSFKAKAYDSLMSVQENMIGEAEKKLDLVVNKESKYGQDKFTIIAKDKVTKEEIGSLIMNVMERDYNYFGGDISKKDFDAEFNEDKFVRISSIDTEENARKEGVGTTIMKKALEVIKSNGYGTVYLNASPMAVKNSTNHLPLNKLVNFYEKLGFRAFLNQGDNVHMILHLNNELNEVKYLPYNDKEEMKPTPTNSTTSYRNFKISNTLNRMTNAAIKAKDNPKYYLIPKKGNGIYQVKVAKNGFIRAQHTKASGDMQQLGGAFQPSDLGQMKSYEDDLRYYTIAANTAEDAADKVLVIFKDDILDFLQDSGSYTDDTAAQHSQQSMDDKMKLHKQKKDLEMRLKRRLSDMEWQNFLDTGEEPKPKTGISMDPDKLSDVEKRQAELKAKYDAMKKRRGA